MKVFSLVLISTLSCCWTFASAQGFTHPNRGISDMPSPFNHQYRRQLNAQQHILSDVHQHHTQPRQSSQGLFLQQSPSVEVPLSQQQQLQQQRNQLRFPASNVANGQNQFGNHIPNNQQFQRSTQNQVHVPQNLQQQYQPQQPQHFQHPQGQQHQQPPLVQQQQQQQQPLDLHHQNFLALRNYASQTVGPQQSLPQRSYNNKPFQNQAGPPPLLQQPQYSTLPNEAYQQQAGGQGQNFALNSQILQQTQQKLPAPAQPVPTFQTHAVIQKPYSTATQYYQQQQQQQPQQQQQQQQLQPQQQHQPLAIQTTQQTFQAQTQQKLPQLTQNQQFVLTPNLRLPVPNIFPDLRVQQQNQQQQQQQQHQQQQQQQVHQNQQQFEGQVYQEQQQQNPEQEYKQKIIQKHEQFVQKQYEKSQNKVKQQHAEFVAKQQTLKQQVLPSIIGQQGNQQQQQQHQQQQIYVNQEQQQFNYVPNRSRPVGQAELPSFASAVKNYYKEHPTTTTTTTTTTSTTTPAAPPPAPKVNSKAVYGQLKAELGKFGQKTSSKKPVKTFGRDELLKQLKAALAETPQKELGNKTYEEMDLVLPNGERVQVIRTTDPNLVKGQQSYTHEQLQTLFGEQNGGGNGGEVQQISFSDIAPDSKKELRLPNGGKVEILRSPNPGQGLNAQSLPGGVDLSNLASLYGGSVEGVANGANSIASTAVIQSDSDEPPSLEELAKRGLIPDGYEIEGLSSKSKAKPAPTLPPKKKATYVYLEEQADGSFKIQGVKANGEKETKQTGSEVESILERIRNGDIKLPPSVTRLTLPNEEVVEIQSGNIVKTTQRPKITTLAPRITTTTQRPASATRATTYRHFISRTTTAYQAPPTTTPAPATHSHRSNSTPRQQYTDQSAYVRPTAATRYTTVNTPAPSHHQTHQSHHPSTYQSATERFTETTAPGDQHHFTDTLVEESENNEKASEVTIQSAVSLALTTAVAPSASSPSEDLIQILKTNGLFAMAKYLRQSGLDSILNETGPYTIFVPTDKAFKNLLVQLGGPERAEEKFKANPRLLSGLLLHHVIPGAFDIATLQDEMTGVSLAGTQLRVNQYNMHDQEWNDVTLTTINGAMVVLSKMDIKIPQGIAHAIDRVMFPLPVGDLLQTLQSDRENRFSTFLKILYTSGLSEKLQSKGVKTYTVFAPVDKSFADIESDTLEKLQNNKESAEEFAMKHIVPGTLFSAGMRFYQVKDSLQTGKTVILQKTSAGKIKVNDAQMITSNIPATNGVIHALDGVLT